MSTLKHLADVSFDDLSITDKLSYLRNSLTTNVPVFNQMEPVVKKNRFFDHLAKKPVRCWMSLALVMGVIIWGFKITSSISDVIAILLWSAVILMLVAYFVWKKKVDAFFTRLNGKMTEKFIQEHERKLAAYHSDLAKHEGELGEYNAIELSYEQASSIVEQAMHYHGVKFCRTQLGVDESELVALHFISAPNRNNTSKKFGDHEVFASFRIQYIYMTDNELYEMNGDLDLLSDEISNYSTSRILYSKIKSSEERHNNYNCLNFYTITTSNNDGSESDVMHIPSSNLRPQASYLIQSITWNTINKSSLQYKQLLEARRYTSYYINNPLTYDEFEEAVRYIKNLSCIDYEFKKEMTETEKDVENFKKVKLIIERAVNRKIRESSM
ncbi:hypothetical protein LOZ80_31030 [Paenibacillus sp. HWE-109]|uniref:magnesium transporter n=1 Tax=Paenibacillus sp. HWE-109 TaxID=1306526 RepID=UPI001EDF4984|nr:magnesium transporter [Paenibacillus sp. HWE-109]UKS25943.1 hypothetical protein LOZ80_31030 [Paenibacillus sp. HWE-109]